MMNKQYEKPTVEKVSFAVEDVLMDGGTLPPITGSGKGDVNPPFPIDDNGYQNP